MQNQFSKLGLQEPIIKAISELKIVLPTEIQEKILANLKIESLNEMQLATIAAAKKMGKYIGICGQGPSDHPDLAQWLLAQGIESISLTPDTVVETWLLLARSKAG